MPAGFNFQNFLGPKTTAQSQASQRLKVNADAYNPKKALLQWKVRGAFGVKPKISRKGIGAGVSLSSSKPLNM